MSQNMSPDFLSGGIFQSTGLKKAKQSTVLSLTEESEIWIMRDGRAENQIKSFRNIHKSPWIFGIASMRLQEAG